MRLVAKGLFSLILISVFQLTLTTIEVDANVTEQAFLTIDHCPVIQTDHTEHQSVYFVGNDEAIIPTSEGIGELTRDVYACDEFGNDVSDTIDVYSNVNNEREGKYQVVYKLTNKPNKQFIQTVFVKEDYDQTDKAAFIGLRDQFILDVSNDYDFLKDVYAFDPEVGDVTNLIRINKNDFNIEQEGIYEIEYSVRNTEGVVTSKVVEVFVLNKELPYIHTDEDYFKVVEGNQKDMNYWFEQVSAYHYSDDIALDLTEYITVNDELVNYNQVGNYTLEITVSPPSMNERTITRSIYVLPKESPSIFNASDLTIQLGTKSHDFLANVDILDYDTNQENLTISVIDYQVNVGEEGVYPLYYLVKDDRGNKEIKMVHVTVTDSNGPEIIVNEPLTFEIESIPPVWERVISAIDYEDGRTVDVELDTSEVNFSKLGTYPIYLNASDERGNVTHKVVDVTIIKKASPRLFGVKDQTIRVGKSFNPLKGIEAIDFKDGDISNEIKISGVYDTENEGRYAITLSVNDSDGNRSTDTFTLTVEESPFKDLSMYIVFGGFIFLLVSLVVIIDPNNHQYNRSILEEGSNMI